MSQIHSDLDFATYVGEHRGALLRFAVVLTGDFHLAEDIVADVLGQAFEKWSYVQRADLPHAYLRRMVVNHFLSWRRKWSRVSTHADPIFYDRAVEDASAERAERDAVLTRLATLPAKQRAAVVLHFYEGLPHREIAEIMGCPVGTVRSHLSRGLAVLRIHYDVDGVNATTGDNADG